MPIILANQLGNHLEIEATIDGQEFLDWITIKYTAEVNKGRSITFSIAGSESLERCRMGGIVKVEIGRGGQSHNLTFEGVIKQIRPGVAVSSVTAVDYITHLANSEIVRYQNQDVIGQDLYYLAANAANYKSIDTSQLTEGSGLMVTSDLADKLTGHMTRKEFIDKCFSYMIKAFEDDKHDTLTYIPWRYAIHEGGVMNFYLADYAHVRARSVITLATDNMNLTGQGIQAEINTTRMVNSVTYISNSDDSKFVTVSDEGRIKQYGPHGKVFTFDTERKDRLEELALDEINRFGDPTVSYTVEMSNGEWIALGDLVEVQLPLLKRNEILPVVRYETTIAEEVTTLLTLGEPALSMAEYIENLT